VPTYVAIVNTAEAIRFLHGVNVFGLTENVATDPDTGILSYTLTVPHDDGDLTAREGDYVLLDSADIYHVCPADLFDTMFARQ
jgi:hypothetical protein